MAISRADIPSMELTIFLATNTEEPKDFLNFTIDLANTFAAMPSDEQQAVLDEYIEFRDDDRLDDYPIQSEMIDELILESLKQETPTSCAMRSVWEAVSQAQEFANDRSPGITMLPPPFNPYFEQWDSFFESMDAVIDAKALLDVAPTKKASCPSASM